MDTFIPYGRQTVTEEDIASVVEVLRSAYLTQGPTVPAFEKAVAEHVGARHSVATNSATSALHIACLALGLGPGDHLWTTPITFVASANCGRYCGADVDFVDIDSSTGLMCTQRLEEKLKTASKEGVLPRVVIPVHLCGASCDMEQIWKLSREYGFSIIEDASHAIGGKYRGQDVGGCKYSDITVFSFHPVKIITSGEGGMAVTNDSCVAERMRRLRSHGITKDAAQFEYAPAGPWTYEQQELGYNYRMTDIQAALGRSQLQRLGSVVKERNNRANCYKKALRDVPVQLLEVPAKVLSAYHLAVVRLDNATSDKHRKTFEAMRAMNIGVQLHYSPVHLQPYYKKLGFKKGDFPEAESYAGCALSVPIFQGLSGCQVERIAKSLEVALR